MFFTGMSMFYLSLWYRVSSSAVLFTGKSMFYLSILYRASSLAAFFIGVSMFYLSLLYRVLSSAVLFTGKSMFYRSLLYRVSSLLVSPGFYPFIIVSCIIFNRVVYWQVHVLPSILNRVSSSALLFTGKSRLNHY